MTRDWDARTYDRVADPMTAGAPPSWIGCRSRRRARPRCRLRQRPGDGAAGGATAARPGRCARWLARRWSKPPASGSRRSATGSSIVVADLGQPLPIDGRSTPSFSTATFHWVPDHDALFRNLAAVLAPGGRLVAQCGGFGNIASIQRVLATIGDGWLGPAHFETPLATTTRLDAAGFVDIECWLTDEPTRFEPGEAFETYLRTVVLGAHLERLPPADRDAFVHAVASRLPEPLIDYVRLNILARRSRAEPPT